MTAKIKLPFGLNENNTLVHISDVESGKKCGCVCPSCRSPLIAAKGRKNQHHFKHAGGHTCEGGLESAIHLAAKQIIMQKKEITLPEYVSTVSKKDSRGEEYTASETIAQGGTVISFDSTQEEAELHGMKADIFATKGQKQLIIEIFYQHKVEDEKIEKIAKANISAIEINLSDLSPDDVKDWEIFWSTINDPQRVQWLYNAKAHRVEQRLGNRLEEEIHTQEKRYNQKEIAKQKQAEKEKAQLLQALEDLAFLHSEERIAQLKKESEEHPVWKRTSRYLSSSWQELPEFLNVDVPDGDWIFGCDRRVWQTAFYSYFINREESCFFSVSNVDKWLQSTVGCEVSRSAAIVGIYGRKYPQLVPANLSDNLPSSWKTLKAYFWHLRDLRILEFSGKDSKHPGSFWFEVINRVPSDEAEQSEILRQESTLPCRHIL